MRKMNKGTAALLGLIGGLLLGTFFTWLYLRQLSQTVAAAKKVIENLETWDMKELPDGTIHVEVHRKVKR